MNATTWLDRTNYFAVLPSEHLETLIEIEADRMRNAYIKEEQYLFGIFGQDYIDYMSNVSRFIPWK